MSELMNNYLETLYQEDNLLEVHFSAEEYDYLCVPQEEIYA